MSSFACSSSSTNLETINASGLQQAIRIRTDPLNDLRLEAERHHSPHRVGRSRSFIPRKSVTGTSRLCRLKHLSTEGRVSRDLHTVANDLLSILPANSLLRPRHCLNGLTWRRSAAASVCISDSSSEPPALVSLPTDSLLDFWPTIASSDKAYSDC